MGGFRIIIGTLVYLAVCNSLSHAQTFLDSLQIRPFTQAHYRVASFNYTGLEGLDHKIYFANESGVLSYDGNTWTLNPIKDFKSVISLAQAEDSTLFIGAENEIGFMHLKDDEYRYTSLSERLKDQVEIGEVWQTIVHEANIYFTSYSGIFKYDGTQVTWIDLPNSHTFNLDGRLIASVFGKGLFEIIDDKPVLMNAEFSFENDIAFAFLPDLNSSGYFLLTSENGIYRFDPETFSVKEVESELSLFSQELWFYDATVFNDSLYAISTWKGGLIIMDDKLEVLKVINTKNGLNTDEMKEVFEGSRGHLWVATNSGISELYWSGLNGDLHNPKTIVTLRNEKNENSISFEFATPGYHISELEYMCFLEGFETEFIPIKDGFKKEYTNLDGGDYTFRVKAKLPDGNYSKEALYPFTVPTPWYLTAQFISLSIFGLGGIFFLFYYLRTKQLKVMNETLESLVERRTKELVFQKDQLKAANDHLKVINSELDNFVYRSSHDLVAPLKSLRGLILLASADRDPKGLEVYFDKMHSSVVKLEEFIRSIMEYSTNSKVEIAYETAKFDDLIEGVSDDLRFYDNADQMRFIKSYDLDFEIFCDVKRVHILLSNLITNAIKYHNYDQEDPFIEVKLELLDREYVITVRDNGAGIRREHLANIFDMFYRASEISEGSGLGLYIVQETLKTLGGKVEVESQLGLGTTFRMYIKRKLEKEPTLA